MTTSSLSAALLRADGHTVWTGDEADGLRAQLLRRFGAPRGVAATVTVESG